MCMHHACMPLRLHLYVPTSSHVSWFTIQPTQFNAALILPISLKYKLWAYHQHLPLVPNKSGESVSQCSICFYRTPQPSMIVSTVQVAVSAAVVAIAGSCGRNMLQSMQVTNQKNTPRLNGIDPSFPKGDSADAVKHLQSLKRKELLELFMSSEVPTDLSKIAGEWDGILLENNGPIMTKISNLMTNGLFALGGGRRWAGKRFSVDGKSGINRFFNENTSSYEAQIGFDVSIHDSSLHAPHPCIRLVYSNHQSSLSLWKTMVDELRILPGYEDVLLGVGSMAWSGGSANSAPFCLHRIPEESRTEKEVCEEVEEL